MLMKEAIKSINNYSTINVLVNLHNNWIEAQAEAEEGESIDKQWPGYTKEMRRLFQAHGIQSYPSTLPGHFRADLVCDDGILFVRLLLSDIDARLFTYPKRKRTVSATPPILPATCYHEDCSRNISHRCTYLTRVLGGRTVLESETCPFFKPDKLYS